MHDIADLHRRSLAATQRLVEGVGPDQWSLDSPCEGWDVRELVNHTVGGNLWAKELAGGRTIPDVGDALDGDVLGDDPAAAYRSSAALADEAFSADGAMEAPCAVSYGPVPGSVYAGHRFVDVLIHGWDLAKATGQDTTLDRDLVEGAREVIAPQAELLQASGMFGGEVDAPEGADDQTRLLAVLGRRP